MVFVNCREMGSFEKNKINMNVREHVAGSLP